jgi:hypothetical protein
LSGISGVIRLAGVGWPVLSGWQLGVELGGSVGSGMETLELRGSRSSLAGVVMAAAVEGLSVAEAQAFVEHGAKGLRLGHGLKVPHGVKVPPAVGKVRGLEHHVVGRVGHEVKAAERVSGRGGHGSGSGASAAGGGASAGGGAPAGAAGAAPAGGGAAAGVRCCRRVVAVRRVVVLRQGSGAGGAAGSHVVSAAGAGGSAAGGSAGAEVVWRGAAGGSAAGGAVGAHAVSSVGGQWRQVGSAPAGGRRVRSAGVAVAGWGAAARVLVGLGAAVVGAPVGGGGGVWRVRW